MMMSHQLLKPALLFVVNLPSSWSLCDVDATRRDAHVGKCRKLKVIDLVKRAADKEGVVSCRVIEAYEV